MNLVEELAETFGHIGKILGLEVHLLCASLVNDNLRWARELVVIRKESRSKKERGCLPSGHVPQLALDIPWSIILDTARYQVQ